MVTIKSKFMLKAPKGYPTLYGWWGRGKGKGPWQKCLVHTVLELTKLVSLTV